MHPSLQDVGHLYTSEYYVMLYFDPLSYLVAHIPFSFGFSNVLECTSVLIDIAIILHKRWKPISYLLELALNRDYSLVLSFNFQPIRSWCCPVLPLPSICPAVSIFSHLTKTHLYANDVFITLIGKSCTMDFSILEIGVISPFFKRLCVCTLVLM